jgi:predicted nucleic acid-binding protein
MTDPAAVPASAAPALVVLDTNALLDWLVFRHPACADWQLRLADNGVTWIATAAMRDEWLHVLARGVGAAWEPAPGRLEAAWAALARLHPGIAPPLTVPRCSDADDQKFIDLAIGAGARWLVTRDRALLKLRRRLQRFGVEALTPEGWNSAWLACQAVEQAPR